MHMEVLLATPAVTTAATEVRTDMTILLELCDVALTMAGGRGDTELTDILKRVRGLAKKKSKRHRSPSSKRCSAKRPRKVQREKKAAAAEAAAAEAAAGEAAAEEAAAQEAAEMVDEVMELAVPERLGKRTGVAGKRIVVTVENAEAAATEAEAEEEEAEEAEEATMERRRREPRPSATGQAATTVIEEPTPRSSRRANTASDKGVKKMAEKKKQLKKEKTRGQRMVNAVRREWQRGGQ